MNNKVDIEKYFKPDLTKLEKEVKIQLKKLSFEI
jgi:hypothetical protein